VAGVLYSFFDSCYFPDETDWLYILQLINPAVPVISFLTWSLEDMSFLPSLNIHFGYSSWIILFYLVFYVFFVFRTEQIFIFAGMLLNNVREAFFKFYFS